MSYPKIDPRKLTVYPLAQRASLSRIEGIAVPASSAPAELPAGLLGKVAEVADRICAARERRAAVMLTYGAHLVKNGGGPLLDRLIEQGFVTHLATQGAGVIHDWEFSYHGESTESVRDNAPVGRFGSWDETGYWINLAVAVGAAEGLGMGESVGRLIENEGLIVPSREDLERTIRESPGHRLTGARADLLQLVRDHDVACGELNVPHPFKRYSAVASAYRHRVPLTVHPGIGYDIIVNHPMYHGAAIGRGADTDTRVFAQSVDSLDGGVYLSIGSAIMSPQVFEKAFSAANNLRHSEGRPFIRDHLIVVVDLQEAGSWDWTEGEPPKDDPAYYLRFCKTFARMAGEMQYLQVDNIAFLQALLTQLADG